MVETEPEENVEFRWGKRKSIGGKKKDVIFYESFTYDGVEYFLYDSVYLFKEGEPEPYIGKIIKIWQNHDKTKKVKILWFFRSREILNYLGAEDIWDKEVFLACGDGVGLANINPLEVIAGKCSILCVSDDGRNPQPSDEALKKADFVFFRTFDVGKLEVCNKLCEQIAGIEVKLLLNKVDASNGVNRTDKDGKYASGNALVNTESGDASAQNIPSSNGELTLKTNEISIEKFTQENVDLKASLSIEKSSNEEKSSACGSDGGNGLANPGSKQENILDDKASPKPKIDSNETPGKDIVGRVKNPRDSTEVERTSVKKAKLDTSVCGSDGGNGLANTGSKQENILDDKVSPKPKIDSNETLGKDIVGRVKNPRDSTEVERMPVKKAKLDTGGCGSDGGNGLANTGSKQENILDDKASPKPKIDSNETPGKDVEGRVKNPRGSTEVERTPAKKAKLDSSVQLSLGKTKDDILKPCLNSNNGDMLVSSPKVLVSEDTSRTKTVKDSHGTKDSLKKPKLDENPTKVSNGKKLKASSPSVTECKTDGQIMEVTRRPDADRSRWFKGLPWEERIANAHEQGTLVLIQNLDPAYTSGEVEDIIWHAFNESCTAKMIQRTTISMPHIGQAYVVFKTKEAAEKVVRKLDEGCLLLANGGALVGSFATPHLPSKKQTFFGHHSIDKLRHQMQQKMKEAVSTSHCSQPNTVEYDMAMEWCLLQERSEIACKKLFKQQEQEFRKLKSKLKSR